MEQIKKNLRGVDAVRAHADRALMAGSITQEQHNEIKKTLSRCGPRQYLFSDGSIHAAGEIATPPPIKKGVPVKKPVPLQSKND